MAVPSRLRASVEAFVAGTVPAQVFAAGHAGALPRIRRATGQRATSPPSSTATAPLPALAPRTARAQPSPERTSSTLQTVFVIGPRRDRRCLPRRSVSLVSGLRHLEERHSCKRRKAVAAVRCLEHVDFASRFGIDAGHRSRGATPAVPGCRPPSRMPRRTGRHERHRPQASRPFPPQPTHQVCRRRILKRWTRTCRCPSRQPPGLLR